MNRSTFMIGTNGYHKFILNLLSSIDPELFKSSQHEIIVLTDAVEDFCASMVYLKFRDKVKVVEIAPYGWPDATLLRFKLMLEHWELANGKFVGYLDADCLVRDSERFLSGPSQVDDSLLYFVAHPGYFQSPLWKRIAMASPYRGVYESRKSSTAFVPLKKRFGTYVCGGHWFGGRRAIRQLLEELDHCVDEDLGKDLIARFHDESHLNRFSTEGSYQILNPEWAYSSSNGRFRTALPIVEVIDKDETWFEKREMR
jgi:hypothetical protein